MEKESQNMNNNTNDIKKKSMNQSIRQNNKKHSIFEGGKENLCDKEGISETSWGL